MRPPRLPPGVLPRRLVVTPGVLPPRLPPGVLPRRLVVTLVLPILVAAGGCGPAQASPGSSSAALPSASSGTSPAAPGASGEAAPSSTDRQSLVVDDRLLDVLPTEIDGVALEPDPSTAAEIATDPTLAGFAEAIAVAFAISPAASSGDDLAIASVIRLRPGVFSEAWFERWRTTYDTAACEPAGGVTGYPTTTEIAGRTVHVGTCVGDALTYHVHLADPDIIVSVTAAGPGQFGELVMAGLAE